MAKRNGFFKRTGNPVLLNIGRSQQLVKTGDVILADFDSMMEKNGWMFVPKFDPRKEKMEPQNAPAPAQIPSTPVIQITDMNRVEMKRDPKKTASESMIDKRYNELVESRVIQLSNVNETAQPKQDEEIVINFDTLKSLKSYSNQDWFKLSKEQCKDILNKAHIDHSHVANEKWELVRFIKTIIKDIKD